MQAVTPTPSVTSTTTTVKSTRRRTPISMRDTSASTAAPSSGKSPATGSLHASIVLKPFVLDPKPAGPVEVSPSLSLPSSDISVRSSPAPPTATKSAEHDASTITHDAPVTATPTQLSTADIDHVMEHAAGVDIGLTVDVRRTASLVSESAATPRIQQVDEESPSIIESTPPPSANGSEVKQQDMDGDVEMKHAEEEPELFSLSQPNAHAALEARTFSAALTPIQLTQEDEDAMVSPTIMPLPTPSPPLTPATPTKSLTPVGASRSRSAAAACTPSPASCISPVKLLKRADAVATHACANGSADMVHRPLVKVTNKKRKVVGVADKTPRYAYAMADLAAASVTLQPPESSFHMNSAAATCCGYFRKLNQDTFVCQVLRGIKNQSPIFVNAIFDGHGILGHMAAELCKDELPMRLSVHLTAGMEMQQAIERTIADMNTRLNTYASMIRGVALGMVFKYHVHAWSYAPQHWRPDCAISCGDE
jgi:hypothetical protein